MIRDHKWRPPHSNGTDCRKVPVLQRPCCFFGCGRPRGEHERSVSGRYRP